MGVADDFIPAAVDKSSSYCHDRSCDASVAAALHVLRIIKIGLTQVNVPNFLCLLNLNS
jgi:hypothetical protein